MLNLALVVAAWSSQAAATMEKCRSEKAAMATRATWCRLLPRRWWWGRPSLDLGRRRGWWLDAGGISISSGGDFGRDSGGDDPNVDDGWLDAGGRSCPLATRVPYSWSRPRAWARHLEGSWARGCWTRRKGSTRSVSRSTSYAIREVPTDEEEAMSLRSTCDLAYHDSCRRGGGYESSVHMSHYQSMNQAIQAATQSLVTRLVAGQGRPTSDEGFILSLVTVGTST